MVSKASLSLSILYRSFFLCLSYSVFCVSIIIIKNKLVIMNSDNLRKVGLGRESCLHVKESLKREE